jgi:hypothetical protein
MHFEVERQIGARPETVWAKLIDKGLLLSGGFGILRIEGEIVPGGRIKLWSEASPKRAFPLKVTAFEPVVRLMVWEGGMPLGLFKGVRRFEISADGKASLFKMREDYSGPLAGVIGKSIPDLNPSFDKFASALKRAAEGA